jgi:hypothetical protein
MSVSSSFQLSRQTRTSVRPLLERSVSVKAGRSEIMWSPLSEAPQRPRVPRVIVFLLIQIKSIVSCNSTDMTSYNLPLRNMETSEYINVSSLILPICSHCILVSPCVGVLHFCCQKFCDHFTRFYYAPNIHQSYSFGEICITWFLNKYNEYW